MISMPITTSSSSRVIPRTPRVTRPIGPGILLREADRFAVLRGEQHILLAVGQGHGDQLVALVQIDGDDAAGADVGVFLERRSS